MENNSQSVENNETNVSEKMTEDFTGLYDIRDYKESDKNFIMASFLKGLYYGDSWFSKIPKDVFMANYKRVIEYYLQPGKCAVKIACLPDDPDIIIGYSILSADYSAIVWVYVKNSKLPDGSTWRRHGIGKRLVPQYPTAVLHLTKIGESLLSKYPTAIFNPFHNL
jgi:hypothetical protein